MSENTTFSSSTGLADALFDLSAQGIFSADAAGIITKVNAAFCELTGHQRNEFDGCSYHELLKQLQFEGASSEVAGSLEKSGIWKGTVRHRKRNGELLFSHFIFQKFASGQGNREGIVCIISSVADSTGNQESATSSAYYDILTHLPNRSLFMENCNHVIFDAQRNDTPAAIILVDIDRFQYINKTYGYSAGDKVITQVGKRIRAAIRKSDFVARIGDDQFTIATSQVDDVGALRTIAAKIIHLFKEPVVFNGDKVFISVSIGITTYPEDGLTAEALLKNADLAIREAKKQNHTSCIFYSKTIANQAEEKVRLENELHEALTKNELQLYYQPLIDAGSNTIYSFEALLRWIHGSKGIISPMTFIPIAEESGLIIPIGEWIIAEACRIIKQLEQKYKSNLKVSINISAIQFRNESFFVRAQEIIRQAGINPQNLDIELTESIVMKDLDRTAARLSDLKKMGLQILIDDFGTGYSSLSYLRKLPVDVLKIDRSFIQEISTSKEALSVAKSIIALAHNLNMKTVAEGVETTDQLEVLREYECDVVQGFLFSRPVPMDQLDIVIEKLSVRK
ncbi:MAG: EAL domain-containing protein [Chitinivibrionales bacterium]|nr:EAL domain-containing protein [Chitinivibrionales bacterium]